MLIGLRHDSRPAWLLPVVSTLFTVSLLWKLFSQRPPLFGVTAPPANTNPTCKAYHKEILFNCEDLRLFPNDSPWALLSCDKGRRSWSPTFSNYALGAPEGELFLWNWRDAPEVEPVLIPFKGAIGENGTTSGDFHPVGVSVVPLDASRHRLFVTNQAHQTAFVEVLDFDLKTSSYQHIQTIRNRRIHSPNGIVALDANHFFVTSDMYFSRTWAAGVIVEAGLGLPLAEVLYVALTKDKDGVQGARVQLVAKLAVPSGIEIDRDSKTIWVSSLVSGVYEYGYNIQPKREAKDDKYNDPLFPLQFMPRAFIRTPFWPDNIMLSQDKKLYVSGAYSAEGFFTSMLSKDAKKPHSWTLELLPKLTKQELATEEGRRELGLRMADPANNKLRKEEMRWRSAFWDDGSMYGLVSTGGVVNLGRGRGEGFIGVGVLEEGVLHCQRKGQGRGWLLKAKEDVHQEL